jgi:hypothetical protein
MNKLHMLALVGLMLCASNKASIMGQEQREVLYTLHTLGQDFINVPMITQNIDMFMGVLEMNLQVNTAKLQDADQKIKKTILTNAALFAGAMFAGAVFAEAMIITRAGISKFASSINCNLAYHAFVKDVLLNGGFSLGIATSVFNALNIHDAWKSRSELTEAIALDKEILGKLEEIKYSMSFIEENTDSAENCLLNSAE